MAQHVPAGATTPAMLRGTTKAEALFAAALAPSPQRMLILGGPWISKELIKLLTATKRYRVTSSPVRAALAPSRRDESRAALRRLAWHADTWTGSRQQLLVVLSWVRALDLSTAAVTGALSKPSGTPATGGTGDLPPKAATPRTMTSRRRRPLSSAAPVPDDCGGKVSVGRTSPARPPRSAR